MLGKLYGWSPNMIRQLTPDQQLAMLGDVGSDSRTGNSTVKCSNIQEARDLMQSLQ